MPERDQRGLTELGQAALMLVTLFFGLVLVLTMCGTSSPDDGDDSNDCYYEEPVPHWDECL